MSTSWTAEQLERIGEADELQIAAARDDGTLRPLTPIWVVCVGDEVFVRTWHRRETGWYGQALSTRRARIRVPGVEIDVTIEDVAEAGRTEVDAAYRAKYGRYGDGALDPMVADAAVVTTLRLSPS